MAAPDYNLVIQRRPPVGSDPSATSAPYIQVGVAFLTDKGALNLKINDGTVLDWRIQETHTVRLYPNTKKEAPNG